MDDCGELLPKLMAWAVDSLPNDKWETQNPDAELLAKTGYLKEVARRPGFPHPIVTYKPTGKLFRSHAD